MIHSNTYLCYIFYAFEMQFYYFLRLAILALWGNTSEIWQRSGMWLRTVFPPLSRGLSQTTFRRESQMCGDDLQHLYSRLHHVSHTFTQVFIWERERETDELCMNKCLFVYLQLWFWCTWPTHGAIMPMNREKRRTLQTLRMTSKITRLKKCSYVTSCFCTIHQ